MREKYAPELNDPILAANLALLTELMMNLKKLNLKLQGIKQIITMMHDSVKSFKCKRLLLVR